MAAIDDVLTIQQEIRDRLAALPPNLLTEQQIKDLINQSLNDALTNPDSGFVRRLKFGNDARIQGSKFARWGLNVGHIEMLYDLMASARRNGIGKGPSEELENLFNSVSEAYYLPEAEARRIDQRALDNLYPRLPLSMFQGYDRIEAAAGRWENTANYRIAKQAMDSAESGFGSQLIGAQYLGELWGAARNESRVASLIDMFEMTDPDTYIPVEVDIPEALFVSENTANNSANYTTVKTGSQRVQLTAKKFVIHQMWSGEMEEDSIVPFVPFLQRQAQLSLAHFADSLVLNGDNTNAATGNINLDDADPADTKHYLAFDGIRHAGLVDNTANTKDLAGAITLNAMKAAKGRMMDATGTRYHDWGHPTDMSDLIYVGDPETIDAIMMLSDVLTVDKFGPGATILAGQAARVLGHPLISSIAVSKTEADGKVSTTGANNTKGQLVVFNRRGFKIGWRRRVKLEFDRLPATDQTRLVYSFRMGFGRFTPTGAASGIECADVIYDISL